MMVDDDQGRTSPLGRDDSRALHPTSTSPRTHAMATARKRRRDRLLPRLALLLSLALLPIGLIVGIQTTRAIQAAEATYL